MALAQDGLWRAQARQNNAIKAAERSTRFHAGPIDPRFSTPTEGIAVRLLLIGDIVGKPGRQIVSLAVPLLIHRHNIDLVVANGENAAAGSGITPAIYQELMSAGVGCITLGDHIYRRNEIIPVLKERDNIVRPANFPATAPGRDHAIVTARDGRRVAVISLLGRVFMRPVDCPWTAIDRVLATLPEDIKNHSRRYACRSH